MSKLLQAVTVKKHNNHTSLSWDCPRHFGDGGFVVTSEVSVVARPQRCMIDHLHTHVVSPSYPRHFGDEGFEVEGNTMTFADLLYQAGFWQWLGILYLTSVVCICACSACSAISDFKPLVKSYHTHTHTGDDE